MALRLALRLAWILAIIALAACGDGGVGNGGELVGGSCLDGRDCAERCVVGGDFPEGMCTVSCFTDNDCPGDTFCIDDEGGICMLACRTPQDCRFGYTCKGRPNRGHGGESLVCAKI